MVGLLFFGDQQVARDVHNLLPTAPPLVFAGTGKPDSAAMLVDPRTMAMKAACFAMPRERDSATATWQ